MSADINLDHVNAAVHLSGGVDLGLDNVRAAANLNGAVNVGLNDIRIRELPAVRVEAALKEVPVVRTDSKVDLGLDNLRVRELPNLKLEFVMKPLRVRLPHSYKLCLKVLGIPLVSFSICGESAVSSGDGDGGDTRACR